jgi:hypothetical protein
MIDTRAVRLSAAMKNLLGGIVIGALATSLAMGVGYLLYDDSTVLPNIPRDVGNDRRSGVMDLICELQLDLDGQLALGINANEPARIAMAQIDFEKSSGWYAGRLAIAEGRGGNLTVQGDRLIVSRPAMINRFGTVINREEFVVDRSSGDFVQTISTQDGRNIKLIRGTCAKVIKPPF